jgi:signal transduction histidine kinase
MIFSLYYYHTHTRDLVQIVLNREFGDNVPRTITSDEEDFLNRQVEALEQRAVANLIFLNAGVIVSSALVMYFLAARTLKPISEAILREKELVANASHELKTPIAAIVAGSEVMLRRGKKNTQKRYTEGLKMINEEANYAGKLVSELLKLYRMDAGSLEIREDVLDLSKLVRRSMDETSSLAEEKNIKVTFTNKASGLKVKGDPDLIKLMITNVLENSVKYNKRGGSIKISLKDYKLAIKDTGIGIEEKEVKRIFEKFYRADNAREAGDGTGLGLSIVKWISEKLKVGVGVSSTLGEGTTFTLDFRRVRVKN